MSDYVHVIKLEALKADSKKRLNSPERDLNVHVYISKREREDPEEGELEMGGRGREGERKPRMFPFDYIIMHILSRVFQGWALFHT